MILLPNDDNQKQFDDWNEWKLLVIYRLDDISTRICNLEKDVNDLKLSFAKSGGVAGLIASVVVLIIYEFVKRLYK